MSRAIAETGTPYVPEDWDGPIGSCSLCGNDAPAESCKIREREDGPLCQPCRLGQLFVHLFCYRCRAANQLLWCRTGILEWAPIIRFGDYDGADVAEVDDAHWDSDDTGTGETWVECRACKAKLADVPYEPYTGGEN